MKNENRAKNVCCVCFYFVCDFIQYCDNEVIVFILQRAAIRRTHTSIYNRFHYSILFFISKHHHSSQNSINIRTIFDAHKPILYSVADVLSFCVVLSLSLLFLFYSFMLKYLLLQFLLFLFRFDSFHLLEVN